MEVMKKVNNAWKIRLTFAGNLPPKEYITADIRSNNPGWGNEEFGNRIIERFEFLIPTGHVLIMEGMQKYNFFVEAVQSTRTKGAAQIKAFWFCGLLPMSNTVEMWRIEDGRIDRSQGTFGQEWGGGPTRGWKRGVPGKAKSFIGKY